LARDDHNQDSAVRWRQVGDIFSLAIELPDDERLAFVEKACGHDPLLLAEVRDLLSASAAAGDFLESFDADLASQLIKEGGGGGREDERIGPFRIERELGRGGMGVVYLARRDDGQFEQRVALKLIKRGMDSEAVLRRFMLERQILARLQHPNIARLHDGGIAENGQSYFAMEYVEGAPLTRYCDANQLGINRRLELFCQVCRAVGYAHQNLVVHRDLKPSNMLVTDDGRLKLLDFGIAKLLQDDAEGLTATHTGDRPMTPQYASPEQMQGGNITTATDVYALGAVLFELLCGRRLYGRERDGGLRSERSIQPSSALSRPMDGAGEAATDLDEIAKRRDSTVPRLRRRLAGDLDRITSKALAEEPSHRYRSAEALLNDIERYLNGMPVEATGVSRTYRLKKFVRRNAVTVTASTAVILALAVGMGAATWQARAKAAEAARAEQISSFLIDLFVASDPDESRRSDLTARELLEAGVARVDTGLVGQPDLQAEILGTVGSVYMKMGLYTESEKVYRRALLVQEQLSGKNSLAYAKGITEVVTALRGQSRFSEASELLRDAVSIFRNLGSDRSAEFALILYDLASLESEESGNYPEAERLLLEAIDILEAHYKGPHTDIARGYTLLGFARYSGGDYAGSAEAYEKGVEMWTLLVGERHRSTAKAMSTMATSLIKLDRTDEAEKLLRRALAIRRQVLGPEHPDVATNLNNLGFVLTTVKDYDAAVDVYRDACTIYRNRLGDDHLFYAICISNLGLALAGAGHFSEADSLLHQALEIEISRLGVSHPNVAQVEAKMANMYLWKQDFAKSAEFQRRSLQTRRTMLEPDHPEIAESEIGLARALERLGEDDEALKLYESGFEIQKGALGEAHRSTVETAEALEAIRTRLGTH